MSRARPHSSSSDAPELRAGREMHGVIHCLQPPKQDLSNNLNNSIHHSIDPGAHLTSIYKTKTIPPLNQLTTITTHKPHLPSTARTHPKTATMPSTGISTPASEGGTPHYNETEAHNTTLVTLADLSAKGTSHYAQRQYGEAADLFARAAELQAELNGEMDPANAEVLFLYGRSLFRVGQSKSDVLGGRAGGEKKKKDVKPKKEEGGAGLAVIAEGAEKAEEKVEEGVGKKPLFQFTGDENFEDSDEDEDAEAEGEEEEDDDELATAFEVLDLARVLFTRRLEELAAAPAEDAGKGKEAETGDSALTRHVKERIADTHDLLAEIALESERFPSAVADFKAALGLKKELYEKASEIIAEAHYKLSLALEFASMTTTGEEGEEAAAAAKEGVVDEEMRGEAADEMQSAIESTKLKLAAREAEEEQTDETARQIKDVKEIVAEMEQRVCLRVS
jgi:HAT1-interacting factor 1